MSILASINFELLNRYGVYALMFVAIGLGVMSLAVWIRALTEERAEKLDADEAKQSGMGNSLSYFITSGQLFRLQVGFAFFAVVIVLATLIAFEVFNLAIIAIAIVAAGFIASRLPRKHYVSKVQKRALAFQAQMLDFSMGLSNGLKAGQALPQALEVYAKNAAEPLFGELRIVQREYHLGVDLAEALSRMYRRIPCEDLQLMIVSIRLTMTSGGSLAEVLEKMTSTIRSRDDFHRKLSALTAQGRFEALAMSLAPVAAFLLLLAVDTELMLPLLTTTTGWIAIGVDAVLITVGYTVIKKITAVEV